MFSLIIIVALFMVYLAPELFGVCFLLTGVAGMIKNKELKRRKHGNFHSKKRK
jgi:hypothetical protein